MKSHPDVAGCCTPSSWASTVVEALARLSAPHSAALRLVYFDQLSHHQAAARADMSVPVFGSVMAAAMRALAAELHTGPALAVPR